MQQQQALFSNTFLYQPSIFKRISDEVAEAAREFREDPKGYVSGAIRGDGLGGRERRDLLMLGLAAGILVFALFFLSILVVYALQQMRVEAAPSLEVVHMVNPDDFRPQAIELPKAERKASGGGGGGRETPTPPSKGQLPKFALTPPIIAPRPEPQLKPPLLAVPETVQVDPRLQPKRDDLALTGLPTGVPGPPSPGPGSGGGMGSGSGGGMGSGSGVGVGPGTGWNTGGGAGGLGGGSGAAVDVVDTKPIQLNSPQPLYTEEARKNKIQGAVIARILIGADGAVKTVRIERGLPDGLNEEAIRAAYQLRFRAAMKNGQPVAHWMRVQIEFNLR